MRKTDRRRGRRQSDEQQQLRLPLRELVREARLDTGGSNADKAG
jgi:hypothetical protein